MKLFRVLSRRLSASVGVLPLVAVLAAWAAIPVAAQTSVPDLTQFGFPNVTGTATFTPGQATTITAGDQTVQLPADFISTTVKFEFLEGDPSFFVPNLEADDKDKQVVATFAFRVTDMSTGNLIGKFDKPVVWSITSPEIGPDSEVYNSSPSNPPKIVSNTTPGTIQGNTLTHSFGGAGVGWLVLSPPASVAESPTPEAVPTVIGMPSTGGPDATPVTLLSLLGLSLLAAGWAVRRSRVGNKG